MARKKPDRLAEEAAKARAAKMSYGKWKAMQIPVDITPEKHICEYCGEAFTPPDNRERKYCGSVCQTAMNRERVIQRKKERKAQNELSEL